MPSYPNSPLDPSYNPSLSATLSSFSELAPMNYDTGAMMNASPNMTSFMAGDGMPSIPGIGGGNGGFFGKNLGSNLNMVFGGLQTLGQLFASFKALNLANKQFQFQKDFGVKNLNNQVQTYNTALADRARSRAAMEGTGQSAADAYVASNRLTGM